MSLLWRTAISLRVAPPHVVKRIESFPDNVAVTKAGYSGRVTPYPGGLMDTGYIQPEQYHDDEDHDVARKAYEPVDHTPDLFKFVRHISHEPERWASMPTQSVSLKQPIYATQPFVKREHLLRYLHNPHGDTAYERGANTPETQDKARDYAFSDEPGFVKYRGRYHVVDGHHRVATEMLRGSHHIEGKVYDADKHGFPAPKPVYETSGWGSQDPGPPR